MANKVDGKSDQPCELSHQIIKKITKDYDDSLLLGTGAFGKVYKGIFENGEEIAVKVLLNMTGIDNKEFQKEFENLRRLRHPNVVQLVGFCNEAEKIIVEHNGNQVVADKMHTALCFEYVRNGSLENHIAEVGCSGLKWQVLYNIIKGICQGLEYLRHGLEFPVWHLDLKPANVLLGNDMIPKIADFGLSKLMGDENTRKTISAVGTGGYLPPEYIEHGLITKEFDIFSLGVIIAKLIAGREDYFKIDSMTEKIFIKHVHDNWRRKLRETLAPRQLKVYCEQVKICTEIAVKCMRRNRNKRPNIQFIVNKLIKTENLIDKPGLQAEQLRDQEPVIPKRGIRATMPEETSSIDWETRFKIIKGICQGLLFLHSNGIIHMNLKPRNILLDNNMWPKIYYSVNRRLFSMEQTRRNISSSVKSIGYMDPHYLYRGEISIWTDIYNLGQLIMEISMGEKKCTIIDKNSARGFVDSVRENWTNEFIALEYPSLDGYCLHQIRECINIGLECVDLDQERRPSIESIVYRLNKLPQRGRLTSSSLSLVDGTSKHMTLRLETSCKIPRRYLTMLPFCGIVPRNSTYTLMVIMRDQKKPPLSNSDNFLTVQSSFTRHVNLDEVDPASSAVFLDTTAGVEVQEEKVVVACESLAETVPNEIIDGANYREVLSIDVHATKPWILTSNEGGHVCIWNYQTQEEVYSVEVSGESVYSAKFIDRQEWFVVGSGDGYIRVYNYITMEEIVDMIKAHDGHRIMSLAVNPSHPLVLSASDDHTIKLWDWTNGWQCTRTFAGHDDTVTQVMFDPRNSESFASSSLDHTVKIWNVHSATCIITWDGHPGSLLCVHYHPWYFQQFLVSGSSDGAAKVWDLGTDTCVDTLQKHGKGLAALCWHPKLRVLVTGSLDGTVRIWKWESASDTYRLENIIGFNLGAINALGYLQGSTRFYSDAHVFSVRDPSYNGRRFETFSRRLVHDRKRWRGIFLSHMDGHLISGLDLHRRRLLTSL